MAALLSLSEPYFQSVIATHSNNYYNAGPKTIISKGSWRSTKCSGSKSVHLLRCILFAHFAFSLHQQCTNSVHFKRWTLSMTSTFQHPKFIIYSTKLQKNMK